MGDVYAVRLDGVAEADGEFLRGVGGDALRGVRDVGVGQADVDDFVDELLRVQDAGIDHNGQAFAVADGAREADDLFVLHFGVDAGVAEQAAVDGKRGVDGVQAGGDFHGLDFVHGVAVGEVHTCFFQCGPAIREVVFDDEVFEFFGVDVGRGIAVFAGFQRGDVFKAVGGKQRGDAGIGARGDFVDHGPGVADVFAFQPGDEFGRNVPGLLPAVRKFEHGGAQFFAVMRHVVHADQRQRGGAFLPAGVEQGDEVADVALRAGGAVGKVVRDGRVVVAVPVFDVVALFGDGEANHLQAGVGGDVAQAVKVVLHGQRFDDAGEDDFVEAAVAFEADVDAEVVIGAVGFLDDFVVVAFGDDDAGLGVALVK